MSGPAMFFGLPANSASLTIVTVDPQPTPVCRLRSTGWLLIVVVVPTMTPTWAIVVVVAIAITSVTLAAVFAIVTIIAAIAPITGIDTHSAGPNRNPLREHRFYRAAQWRRTQEKRSQQSFLHHQPLNKILLSNFG